MTPDVIQLLPDSVANQIAAGEVIQRPASVVKELVENAVDAGATSIQIIVRDAGRTLIQVVDNGCGMSATDARMAFERHATSKIRQADDLYGLHTMGFRGEALPSIAAVARIDMRTMRSDDQMGVRLRIAESQFEGIEPCACVPGTNLMVKDLFFHMPARRKFLKKDAVELSHIMREFERLALVNTGINFTLVHNDTTVHQLTRGNLRQRIGALFGRQAESNIVPVCTETSIARISGYIGLPSHAMRRGAHQFFFVNGRHMRHPYFHKAVMSCYADLIAGDAQPIYFINFEVDPSTIDVNIHPQKHEIKFENEQGIWQILVAAIREALGKVNAVTGIDFDVLDAPEIPALDNRIKPASMPDTGADTNYNPFEGAGRHATQQPAEPRYSALNRNSNNWEAIYEAYARRSNDPELQGDSPVQPTEVAPVVPGIESQSTGACLQLRGRYIVTPSQGGLMVIDQHRAHVRVLYDRYEAAAEQTERMASQRLIFPETVTLTATQNALLESMLPAMEAAGFDLSPLGEGIWAVNGMPSPIASADPTEIIVSIVDDAAADTPDAGDPAGMLRRSIHRAMARAAAIRGGQTLSADEMERLIGELFRSVSPNYTPEGNRILAVITPDEIESMLQ